MIFERIKERSLGKNWDLKSLRNRKLRENNSQFLMGKVLRLFCIDNTGLFNSEALRTIGINLLALTGNMTVLLNEMV